jgi:hypothetical protein
MASNPVFGSFPVKNYSKERFKESLRVNFCRRAAGTPCTHKSKPPETTAADIVKEISPNAWQHVHLIGAFNFEQAESQIDIDALAARYDDPDFWNQAFDRRAG